MTGTVFPGRPASDVDNSVRAIAAVSLHGKTAATDGIRTAVEAVETAVSRA
jgi:hypothetical protein